MLSIQTKLQGIIPNAQHGSTPDFEILTEREIYLSNITMHFKYQGFLKRYVGTPSPFKEKPVYKRNLR